MLHLQGMIAMDLARERAREAERDAARHRMAALLAAEQKAAGGRDRLPGIGRRSTVAVLRSFAIAASSAARSAASVATRLEGRSA